MSFSKRLDGAWGRVIERVEVAQTQTLIRARDVAVLNTPVDEGDLRNAWGIFLGSMADRLPLGATGVVYNPEPYAVIIDKGLYPNPGKQHWHRGELVQRTNAEGYSLQATSGITPLVMAEIRNFFREALRNGLP